MNRRSCCRFKHRIKRRFEIQTITDGEAAIGFTLNPDVFGRGKSIPARERLDAPQVVFRCRHKARRSESHGYPTFLTNKRLRLVRIGQTILMKSIDKLGADQENMIKRSTSDRCLKSVGIHTTDLAAIWRHQFCYDIVRERIDAKVLSKISRHWRLYTFDISFKDRLVQRIRKLIVSNLATIKRTIIKRVVIANKRNCSVLSDIPPKFPWRHDQRRAIPNRCIDSIKRGDDACVKFSRRLEKRGSRPGLTLKKLCVPRLLKLQQDVPDFTGKEVRKPFAEIRFKRHPV